MRRKATRGPSRASLREVPEIDFDRYRPIGRGRHAANPYAKRLGEAGRNALVAQFLASERLVRLDEEVAAEFTSERAVNDALRLVLKLRDVAPRPPKRATTRSAKPRRARARTK